VPIGELDAVDVRELWPAEEAGHLGGHLPRLRVDGLSSAEDEVGSLLPEGQRERPRGTDGVRDRERPVGEVDRPICAHLQREQQRLLGLGRAHGHDDDLAAVALAKPDRLGHGVDVELVQLERDAFPHELPRLLVELDVLRVGDLLDQDDDLHAS
jgi:hypothetical protein